MNADEVLKEMRTIAEENCYELTENAEKIAKFRARANIPMNLCPCDKGNPLRGCIGVKCHLEIKEDGECHCRAFRKIDK